LASRGSALPAGDLVPGLIVTSLSQSIGGAIEEILLIAESVPEQEMADQFVMFLPL
jgi:hypothetical protein